MRAIRHRRTRSRPVRSAAARRRVRSRCRPARGFTRRLPSVLKCRLPEKSGIVRRLPSAVATCPPRGRAAGSIGDSCRTIAARPRRSRRRAAAVLRDASVTSRTACEDRLESTAGALSMAGIPDRRRRRRRALERCARPHHYSANDDLEGPVLATRGASSDAPPDAPPTRPTGRCSALRNLAPVTSRDFVAATKRVPSRPGPVIMARRRSTAGTAHETSDE